MNAIILYFGDEFLPSVIGDRYGQQGTFLCQMLFSFSLFSRGGLSVWMCRGWFEWLRTNARDCCLMLLDLCVCLCLSVCVWEQR